LTSKKSSQSLGCRIDDNDIQKNSFRHKSVSKRQIPILPRRATPSNVRCRSNNYENYDSCKITDSNQDIPSTTSALSNYQSNRYRSRRSSKDNKSYRYSIKSVDHVKEYVEKKKVKDTLFSHIKNHINIVEFEKFIKTKNPDLNCRDDEWHTPLHVATNQNMSTAWINILIRHGADINRLTPTNKSPLHYACMNNNISVVALLLRFKANSNIIDKDGNTPLQIAMKNNDKEMISLILSKTKEMQFKSKNARPSRSVDLFKKFNTLRNKSIKNENPNTSRQSQQFSTTMSKKYSQYGQYSSTASKHSNKGASQHTTSAFNTKLSFNKDVKGMSNTSIDQLSSKNTSFSKNKYTALYKTTRLAKAQLNKIRNDSQRAEDRMNANYAKKPLSIKTPISQFDKDYGFKPWETQKRVEEDSKGSSKNSTLAHKSTVQNYEMNMFNTNPNSDSDSFQKVESVHPHSHHNSYAPASCDERAIDVYSKQDAQSAKHKRIGGMMPQDKEKKQSQLQGGFVKETKGDIVFDQEYSNYVGSDKGCMEAPERGNKAESEIGSKLDSPNDEVILQTKQKFLDIDKVSSGDKNPIEMAMNSARSEISSGVGVFQYDSKGPELAISPEIKKPKLDKVDDEPEEEEKIYYRGRGLQKDMKKTNIPKEYSRSNGVAITPNMFKIESSLGKGAFGKVFLVTMKENGKEYAMKVLSKAEIIKSKITRYAVTEKNVMSRISHPFIVGLNYAFQTDDLLYLILDY